MLKGEKCHRKKGKVDQSLSNWASQQGGVVRVGLQGRELRKLGVECRMFQADLPSSETQAPGEDVWCGEE